MFYGGTLSTVILYLQLAKNWPKLLKNWCTLDKLMNIKYGYPKGMDMQIKLLMGVFVTLSLGTVVIYTKKLIISDCFSSGLPFRDWE